MSDNYSKNFSIWGILFCHGKNDYEIWEGFRLSEDELNQIMQILMEHDTEGCSIRGTLSEIAQEIGEYDGKD